MALHWGLYKKQVSEGGDSIMEKYLIILLYIAILSLPLWLGALVVWTYREFIDKDSYCRDFISGLIFLAASREFFRNFRCKRKF